MFVEDDNVQDEGRSQEVPSLVLDLSEEIHRNYELQYIEGFEDLGVFYPNDVMKEVLFSPCLFLSTTFY